MCDVGKDIEGDSRFYGPGESWIGISALSKMAYSDRVHGVKSPAVSIYKLVTYYVNPQGAGDR